MILGIVSLAIALLAAVVGASCYFMAARGRKELLRHGRRAVYTLAGAATIASVYLLWLLLSHQFQVAYVANYTDKGLPVLYLVSAFWAGQEGSFLLWALLAAWIGVVLVRRGDRFEPEVLVSVLVTQAALLVMLLARSPFAVLPEVPADGAGLNPLLQNPWMAIHPPILFVGYAGLVVPFAYAVAALWKQDYLDWATIAWPWTLFSWVFLGAGLAIGGFWAYETLGWGGYWGWDPVENSSLVPWLTATALAHGLVSQKTRGALARGNFFLAILTFSLVLYATFLTRSGILSESSVHSFGDTGLAPFLLAVVLASVVGPLWLFVSRYNRIPRTPIYEKYISRDFAMLLTLLVIMVLGAVVLVGTSTPIVTKASLRPAFYNATSSPLALVLAMVLSICPLLAWRESDLKKLLRLLVLPAALGLAGAGLAFGLGMTGPLSLAVAAFGIFAAATNAAVIVRTARSGLWKLGGYLAHVGVGLMLVGIIGSGAYSQTEQLRISEAQSGQALGYTFTFNGLKPVPGSDRAVLELRARRGTEAFLARPSLLPSREGMVRTPFIKRYWNEDIYVAPGDYAPGQKGGNEIRLMKGQTEKLGGFSITFLRFDMSAQDTAGVTTVAAVLQVAGATASGIVSPTISADAEGLKPGPKVGVPGSIVTFALIGLDPGAGAISLVAEGLPGLAGQATPAVASFEISRKPAINLLWAGVLLVVLGTAIAVQRRRLELAKATRPTR